jgi:hypothetical protein
MTRKLIVSGLTFPSRKNELNPMDKFNFLLGTWKLEYKVPKSHFSDYDS